MSVQVIGVDETISGLDVVLNGLMSEAEKEIRAGAFMVQSDAIKSIQRGNKTGRTYKRGNVTHQASAPGEAPASDTGNLASSILAVPESTSSAYLVGSNLSYSKELEFGTKEMKPRPWLIPALESNRKQIERNIQLALSRKL